MGASVAQYEAQSRRRFTAHDVMRMLESGVLHEDEPLELLDGELIVMSPQGPEHGTTLLELSDRLRAAYADAPLHVRTQLPIRASENSLPEPDVAVVRGRPRDYRHQHPGAEQVVLAVEIAVTSHAIDRAKANLYGAAAVPEYWLIDVLARRLHRHRRPCPEGGYGQIAVLPEAELVVVPELDLEWPVSSLLL